MIESGSIVPRKTLPVPTSTLLPTTVPGRSMVFMPMKTLLPIFMGRRTAMSVGSMRSFAIRAVVMK